MSSDAAKSPGIGFSYIEASLGVLGGLMQFVPGLYRQYFIIWVHFSPHRDPSPLKGDGRNPAQGLVTYPPLRGQMTRMGWIVSGE